MRKFVDVHDSHCCKKHGCKYNSQDCTVESGLHQGIKCEMCEFDDEYRQKLCTEYDLVERGKLVEYLESYMKKTQDNQCYESTYVTVTISNLLEFVRTL